MRLAVSILPVLAALVGCASPQAGDGASVYAVIDQSEWAPPGYVRLDLVTGHYELKPQPPRRSPTAEMPIRRGTLAAAQLGTFREAYAAARSRGLKAVVCPVIVSNAGPISMELSGGGGRLATPEELGCWSEEARRLHDLLEGLF